MKVIIITGTSFGLGLSIAKKCLEAGCSVFGIGRSPATLKETQNLKTSYPTNPNPINQFNGFYCPQYYFRKVYRNFW